MSTNRLRVKLDFVLVYADALRPAGLIDSVSNPLCDALRAAFVKLPGSPVEHDGIGVVMQSARQHRAARQKKPSGHVAGGNCWHRKRASNDVCKLHDEPRGECSGCPRCPKCDAEVAAEKTRQEQR